MNDIMANVSDQVKLPVFFDKRCIEYSAPGHPERPQRIIGTQTLLESQTDVPLEWISPVEISDERIRLAHTDEHLRNLTTATEDFDADTPAYEGIERHARRSAGAALGAMEKALEVGKAFSLMRPPGHHATPGRAMGFCYLSNIAIAALEARSRGIGTIAILDFDVHHGNGTEDVIKDCANIVFASIHQSPCYPGTGLEDAGSNCFNYPVRPRTDPAEYLGVIRKAMDRLKSHRPDMLLVSAGFDAYKGDPIAQELLDVDDFHKIGRDVRSFDIPTAAILEGGYSDDLPKLVHAFLKGWAI